MTNRVCYKLKDDNGYPQNTGFIFHLHSFESIWKYYSAACPGTVVLPVKLFYPSMVQYAFPFHSYLSRAIA